MKKLLLLAAIAAGFKVVAQPCKLGVIAGTHFSNISKAALRESSSAANIHVGLIADCRISQSSFYIQGQLLYSPMGYKSSNIQAISSDGNSLGTIASHRISYVQLPVYLLTRIPANKARLKIGAGSFVALKTGDKIKIQGGDTFGNGTALPGGTTRISSTTAGVGLQMAIERSGFTISGHYQYSLNNGYQNSGSTTTLWKIHSFGISVACFFISKPGY